MNKQIRPIAAFLVLTIAMMACAVPSFGNNEPATDQVATVVALTMQALTPVSNGGVTPQPEPEQAGVLPHSLYYLGTDNAGLTQVFRIDKDGKTIHQITSETANVKDYGVSPVDGSVAYVVNNQLILLNASGSDRKVLVDAGPMDENNPFLTNILRPVFSPNGQTLAYGYKGLNLYSLSTGVNNLVIEDQIDSSNADFKFPKELYWPEKYSPDGSKLLITLGYYEGASAAIYYPESKALVRLQGGEGALICCDLTQWSADGTRIHSASASVGMFNAGLWEVDAATGKVSTLLESSYDTSTFNLAKNPYLAPDNQLYYFFTVANTEPPNRVPLQLVRSAPDGVTGRTTLSQETFELMNEALWAPDASLVIVAFAPIQDVYQGGQAEIVYLDGRPGVVLTTYAQQMLWGP